ncbi:hypothetical protein NCW_00693 [Burkholderia pseudomallei]|nr:hypothetical protein Y603_1910 [Burkholderia pseudomallei MSHR1153]
MTHGPTTIKSKGACIYCGRSGIRLTDEHILPFFLGGVHILKEASCDACAKITSRFELDVARHLWGDARASFAAPTRRKKARKTNIVLNDPRYPDHRITVPYSEYPGMMVFYIMNVAGALLALPADVDQSGAWVLTSISDDKRIKTFEQKYPGRLIASFRHVPESFGRLIAKIGYGQILCSLDPGDFEPICLPYILGDNSNLSHIVGGRQTLPPPQPGIGYELASHFFGTSHQGILLAEVRMVANCQTPIYHVVVGKVTGEEQVANVLAKLEATCTISITNEATYRPPSDERLHWVPRLWPLPILSQ